MQDNRDLLRALKIERDPPTEYKIDTRKRLMGSIAGVSLVGVAIVILAYPVEQDGNEIKIPTAQLVAERSLPTPGDDLISLNATGYITARRIATVSSEITGKVEELFFEEGSKVKKGALLARLNSDLAEAELTLVESRLISEMANLDELNVDLRSNQLRLERIELLHRKNLTSQSSLDQALLEVEIRKARITRQEKQIEVVSNQVNIQLERLHNLEIRAPFDGVIIAKTAQAGEMISPISAGGGFTRTGIGTLVDMQSLEVEVDISETSIDRISNGQSVKVVLNSYPGLTLPAEVITIVPAANRNKATVKVRIGLLVRDARIIPNMGVKVSFMALPVENTSKIPVP